MGLAGSVMWAVVPFVPEAPFRIYAGPDSNPREIPDVQQLINAATKQSSQFTYLVQGKARPALILSDATDEGLGEHLALRLISFDKLTDDEQARVRAQESATHFHLKPDKFPGLSEENAALVGSLVRVHRSALGSPMLGQLDRYELATVHERLVRYHRLNIHGLVMEQLRDLAARQAEERRREG